MNLKNTLLLLGCILLTLSVGGLSGFATASGIKDWYPTLVKPSFNPPNWLFAPVWTVLYILMGVSFYIILKAEKSTAKQFAVKIFYVQLFLNFIWSFLFFQFHFISLAFVDIIAMWLAINTMILGFLRVNKWAGILQIPYLIWVSFASLLNGAIVILN